MLKNFLSIFAFVLFFTSSVYPEEDALKRYTVIEDRCGLEVFTPSLSERKTLKLRLENGLEALLISDPGTHQSGAALAVQVGSWDDPKERAGMAHFVEHMLFLGTEKFPEEEGYQRYLDEYDGNRNAYTMADRTVYMFSANNEGFPEALDRFSQFFIAPLFNPSGVDRESKAIDQEFRKSAPQDQWRAHFVKKELANPDHPFHQFCIGNKETLTKISQDELKQWYRTHYSADLMHLVVYSCLPLETLEKQVSECFSAVKKIDSKASTPRIFDPLLTGQTAAKLVAISPLQELQTLELTWELPIDFGSDREVRADQLISHVLGHEGAHSLLAQLKKEHLAETLSAGTYRAGHDQGLFHLSIQLTSKGIENYNTVIQRCFEALAAYRKNAFPKYLFDEIAQLKTLRYSFQEREDIFQFVSDTASGMIDEPLDTFPRKSLMPSTYSPEKVKELLTLLTPDRCHFTLVAPSHLSKMKLSEKEKWMNVDYGIVSISTKQLTAWSKTAPHKNIAFPAPNRFIPQKLTLCHEGQCELASSIPSPHCLIESEGGRLYCDTDTRFLVPEIAWIFVFKTPEIKDADPRSHVLADLYCHTVKERLNAIAYEADVAGLSYSLKPIHNGLKLVLSGYSEKGPAFLNEILTQLKHTQPTPQEFTLYKELAAREYANASTKTPVSQSIELLWSILYKDHSGVTEKEKMLKTVAYDDFVSFCSHLLNTTYVEGMLYGNQTHEEAKQLWEGMSQVLQSAPYLRTQHPKLELAILPEGKDPAFLVKKSALAGNAVLLTTDCGEFSFKRRAAHEILTKGLEEPFFSELRTRQQTAYLVTNWSQEIERHLYSFFLVQSGSHDTRDLLARFELFLESSLQDLSTQVIPRERFEAIRTALITHLEHPAQKMEKMADLLHTLAFDYEGDFSWLDKRIEGIKKLSYEEFHDYAQEFLGKANRRRMAICVNGILGQQERFQYRRLTTPQKIRSEINYRGRH